MNNFVVNLDNEQAFAHRYINGQLNAEEAVLFEEYLMDHPHLLDDLTMDIALKAGLKERYQYQHNDKSTFSIPISTSIFTLAASIIFVALVYFPTSAPSGNSSPSLIYLETYRSAQQIIEVDFSAEDNDKILVIDLPPNSAGEFNLVIKNNVSTGVKTRVLPNSNNEIIHLLSSKNIENGMYKLTLIQSEKALLSFDLHVTKE